MHRCATTLLALGLALAMPSPILAVEPPPLRAVSAVDLQRYLGKWYEIARLPRFFQRQCASDTVAEYKLRGDGAVTILNTCLKANGEVSEAEGTARIEKGSNNAKLKVSFLPPLSGEYWIIALDRNYQWSVVGSPNRNSLWILAREPKLTQDKTDQALKAAREQGFDVAKLVFTPHGRASRAAQK